MNYEVLTSSFKRTKNLTSKKLLIFLTLIFSLFTLCKAQYTVLHSFNQFSSIDGCTPEGALTYASNILYGMTFGGGNGDNDGVIFSVDTTGSGYKIVLNFNGTNGEDPNYGSLTLLGNKLYGMTSAGGTHLWGIIFSIDTNGNNYKKLLDFNDTNGSEPFGSLILSSGVLYGMTYIGGTNDFGCIFSIDTNGSGYKDLWNFDDTGTNGANPYGSLIIFGNKLYGMTYGGGVHDSGCVFSIDTNGNNYKDLLDFDGINGQSPFGSLTLCGSRLYGMTVDGGLNNRGIIFSIDTNGSAYRDLLDFNGINGSNPYASLLLFGNELFGVTTYGGANDSGCIFSIDTNGSGYKDMFDFNRINGYFPWCSLTICGDALYGTTTGGGEIFIAELFLKLIPVP